MHPLHFHFNQWTKGKRVCDCLIVSTCTIYAYCSLGFLAYAFLLFFKFTGGISWHLQKFLQCIIGEFTPCSSSLNIGPHAGYAGTPPLEPSLQPFFCVGYFWDSVLLSFCSSWPWIDILFITSGVGRITGLSHQPLAQICFRGQTSGTWEPATTRGICSIATVRLALSLLTLWRKEKLQGLEDQRQNYHYLQII
jgi:hypothetical protein